jgi:hypothetical protein
VAPVRCQSQGPDVDGRAAAEALAVRMARMVVLENMVFGVGKLDLELLY